MLVIELPIMRRTDGLATMLILLANCVTSFSLPALHVCSFYIKMYGRGMSSRDRCSKGLHQLAPSPVLQLIDVIQARGHGFWTITLETVARYVVRIFAWWYDVSCVWRKSGVVMGRWRDDKRWRGRFRAQRRKSVS